MNNALSVHPMALCSNPHYSLSLRLPLLSLYKPSSRVCQLSTTSVSAGSGSGSGSGSGFTWDDVFRTARSEVYSDRHLSGFLAKVHLCNRRIEKQHAFVPFVIEDQTVGYVHTGFADHLRKFQDVFIFDQINSHNHHHVTLHPMLRTVEERTSAVAGVIKCLGEELIPGIRNELYPISSSFGAPVFFSIERGAAPYFGIKAYGVHMNGYVERHGHKYLWIAKRSEMKPTFPGMLDHLVAGGLPHGISCGENLMKECEEEAGIPSSISSQKPHSSWRKILSDLLYDSVSESKETYFVFTLIPRNLH